MSSELKTTYHASYITDRLPNFYGGRQEEYLKLAEQSIESGVSLISDEIKKKTDPAKIYHIVVKFLQDERHKIALKHQPEKAHFFGTRRDDPKPNYERPAASYTSLHSQYTEYNKKYLEQLIKILHRIPHDLRTFSRMSIAGDEIAMGRKYSFKVELLDMAELQKRKYTAPPTEEDLRETLEIKGKKLREIFTDYSLIEQIKNKNKDLYDRIVMSSALAKIVAEFPSPAMKGKVQEEGEFIRYEKKNIYVLTTLRLELEPNKMVCIARHLTWMYQTEDKDPVDRMRDYSVDFVIHQDVFLIERTQQFCSQIFAEILAWDKTKSTLDELKNRVALLRFVYGNSMPCNRGDGAVGDWLELALYRHHGFKKTTHNSKLLPCFELLTTINLSDYLRNYRETIHVE